MPTAQARLRAVSSWRKGALDPYPASASTQPKRTPAAITRSISASAISGLVRAIRCSAGTFARSNRPRSFVQFSGRKRRNATITGTSPRASVSETSVWQLAVLPRAEAYCAATPTECFPFFGMAVAAVIGVSIFAALAATDEISSQYEAAGLTKLCSLTPSKHIGNRGRWAAQALPFVFGALWLLAMAGAFSS